MRDPIALVREPTPPELVIPGAPPAGEADAGDDAALRECDWVWFAEGQPERSAAPGTRYFRGACTVPADRKVKQARFIGTCDNAFTLFVNGREAGRSSDEIEGWREPTKLDLTKLIAAGANGIAIAALNMTAAPSPAGLIGRIEIAFEDGAPLTVALDATWKASDREQSGWNRRDFDDKAWPAAKALGRYGCAPWGRFASGGSRTSRLTVSPVRSDPFVGRCDLPADIDLGRMRVRLELEGVSPEEAARVRVNDRYAGGFIGRPMRLDVTGCLKPGANRFVIEPFAPSAARLVFLPR